MALALPDAGASFYVDAPNGEAYERFLFDEFLPHLERAHRLDFERPLVVMGLSMGGYGALKLALRRPDRFAAALAFSPMLVPLEELRAAESASEPPWALARLQRVFGTPIDEPLYRANDPLTLAAGAPAQGPALYVAAGEQDRYGFDRGARLFASLLRQRGRACELHLLPTGHGWSLLERDFPAALDFLAGVLAATPSPSAP
jgi:S-formylglutathione hydrolase FrmB